MRIILFAVGIALHLALSIPSLASDYVRQAYNCRWMVNDWTGRRWQECDYRWVRNHYQHYGREYALTYTTPQTRGECLAPRSVVGIEKYNIEEAKDSAISLWMEAEKMHHGVRFMGSDNAIVLSDGGRGPECYVSSTGNRASEKIAEGVAGKVLHQCVFTARPCPGGISGGRRRW